MARWDTLRPGVVPEPEFVPWGLSLLKHGVLETWIDTKPPARREVDVNTEKRQPYPTDVMMNDAQRSSALRRMCLSICLAIIALQFHYGCREADTPYWSRTYTIGQRGALDLDGIEDQTTDDPPTLVMTARNSCLGYESEISELLIDFENDAGSNDGFRMEGDRDFALVTFSEDCPQSIDITFVLQCSVRWELDCESEFPETTVTITENISGHDPLTIWERIDFVVHDDWDTARVCGR